MSAKAITGSDTVLTKDFKVSNKLGIHARPAAMFVKTANRFRCEIFVEKDGERVNGKSIMGLMMLAAGPGSKVTVLIETAERADAVDKDRALKAKEKAEAALSQLTKEHSDYEKMRLALLRAVNRISVAEKLSQN